MSDHQADAELTVRYYAPIVWSIAIDDLGQDLLADEAVIRTFLALWERLDAIGSIPAFDTEFFLLTRAQTEHVRRTRGAGPPPVRTGLDVSRRYWMHLVRSGPPPGVGPSRAVLRRLLEHAQVRNIGRGQVSGRLSGRLPMSELVVGAAG